MTVLLWGLYSLRLNKESLTINQSSLCSCIDGGVYPNSHGPTAGRKHLVKEVLHAHRSLIISHNTNISKCRIASRMQRQAGYEEE